MDNLRRIRYIYDNQGHERIGASELKTFPLTGIRR